MKHDQPSRDVLNKVLDSTIIVLALIFAARASMVLHLSGPVESVDSEAALISPAATSSKKLLAKKPQPPSLPLYLRPHLPPQRRPSRLQKALMR
jgi:hypothetical protein